jgi:hypothetical protein
MQRIIISTQETTSKIVPYKWSERIVIEREAQVRMDDDLAEELNNAGLHEIFNGAEQLWAIREGLADKVGPCAAQPKGTASGGKP